MPTKPSVQTHTVVADLRDLKSYAGPRVIELARPTIPVFGAILSSPAVESVPLLQLQFDSSPLSKNGVILRGQGDGFRVVDPIQTGLYLGYAIRRQGLGSAAVLECKSIVRVTLLFSPGVELLNIQRDPWASAVKAVATGQSVPAAGNLAWVKLVEANYVAPIPQIACRVDRVYITSSIDARVGVGLDCQVEASAGGKASGRRLPGRGTSEANQYTGGGSAVVFGIRTGEGAASHFLAAGAQPSCVVGVPAGVAFPLDVDYELQSADDHVNGFPSLLVQSLTPDATLDVTYVYRELEIA
jgi:hypothetical protein